MVAMMLGTLHHFQWDLEVVMLPGNIPEAKSSPTNPRRKEFLQ